MTEARGHEPGTPNSKRQPGPKYRKASTPVATSEQATGIEVLQSPYDAVLKGDFSQRTFERHRNGALAASGQPGEPDSRATLTEDGVPVFAGYLTVLPGNVCCFLFSHCLSLVGVLLKN